jgi:hypothetical protein
MLLYHKILYIIILIILIIIALISLKIIKVKNETYIITDFLFKLIFGLYIIYFFIKNKNIKLEVHDNIIFILCGLILISLIDYIKVMHIICNKKILCDNCKKNT